MKISRISLRGASANLEKAVVFTRRDNGKPDLNRIISASAFPLSSCSSTMETNIQFTCERATFLSL